MVISTSQSQYKIILKEQPLISCILLLFSGNVGIPAAFSGCYFRYPSESGCCVKLPSDTISGVKFRVVDKGFRNILLMASKMAASSKKHDIFTVVRLRLKLKVDVFMKNHKF